MISGFALMEGCALLSLVAILDLGSEVLIVLLIGIACITAWSFTRSISQGYILCICSILVCFISSSLALVQRQDEVNVPFPMETITYIQGVLCNDGSERSDGKTLIAVHISQAMSFREDIGSASGSLYVLVPSEDHLLLAGQKVGCFGHLVKGEDQSLFLADRVDVITDTYYHHLRRITIQRIEQRLHTLGEPEQSMALALVLGRIPTHSTIYDQAIIAGCVHVLALSGMHIHILLGLCARVLNRITSKRVSASLLVVLSCVYVAIIGPKPSLIRSVILFSISLWVPNFSLSLRLCISLGLQVLVFPKTITTAGAQLSYTALTAIILTSTQIANRFALVMPLSFARIMGVTISASLGTAPLSFFLFGAWRVIGMISGPVIAPLVAIHLVFSCVYLVFPISIIRTVVHLNAQCFSHLLSAAEQWSRMHEALNHPVVTLTCIGVLLTTLIILQYACRVTSRRHQKAYDVGFSLRFPPSNSESSQ
jgi:competence protein ComEC